jgi:hypothetical protein
MMKDRTDLLSDKYLVRSAGPCSSLLSTQIFEELSIG